LKRKLKFLGLAGLRRVVLSLLAAALLAAAMAAGLGSLWEQSVGHHTLPSKLGAVLVPGGIACVAYWLLALWWKVPAATELTGLLLGKLRRTGRSAA
jgi:hypothetical protein